MSWSYSGDPSNSDLDHVRFLIGDTDTGDQQLSDEEILFLLDAADSVIAAAILAIDALIAKYKTLARYARTGDVTVGYGDTITNLLQLKATLIQQSGTPIPYAGGISISDVESVEDDTDRDGPIFDVGMMDNE